MYTSVSLDFLLQVLCHIFCALWLCKGRCMAVSEQGIALWKSAAYWWMYRCKISAISIAAHFFLHRALVSFLWLMRTAEVQHYLRYFENCQVNCWALTPRPLFSLSRKFVSLELVSSLWLYASSWDLASKSSLMSSLIEHLSDKTVCFREGKEEKKRWKWSRQADSCLVV